MSAKQSAEMRLALHLHLKDGDSVYVAAKKAGVYPSSVYKSLRKNRKNKAKKVLTSQ